jgi:hypothetical protein
VSEAGHGKINALSRVAAVHDQRDAEGRRRGATPEARRAVINPTFEARHCMIKSVSGRKTAHDHLVP